MLTDIKRTSNQNGTEYGCVLSADEKYRYVLWRIWDDTKPKWMFVLLNPSTADETVDDPTITRLMIRAEQNGAGGIVVVNTGAIRETDSSKLKLYSDPIGPHNEFWIKQLIAECDVHIAGWGPKAKAFNGDAIVKQIFEEACLPLYALTINKDGSPKHPLYVSYASPLIEYMG